MPENTIAREILWRKSELITLAAIVENSTNEKTAEILRRSGYCLVYAHWEGAIKRMAQAYAASVRKSGTPVGDLHICFRAMIARDAFSSTQGSRKLTPYLTALQEYESGKMNYVYFDFDEHIRAEGNLTSEVLREIHKSIGVEYSNFFKLKEKYIDEKLVKRRNLIAHGDNAPVEADVFELAIAEISSMLEKFSSDLLENFQMRRFEVSRR